MMPNEEREWWCTDVHTLIREQEKRATERLIKEQVHTSHADNSAMESKIMNIQFITIEHLQPLKQESLAFVQAIRKYHYQQKSLRTGN